MDISEGFEKGRVGGIACVYVRASGGGGNQRREARTGCEEEAKEEEMCVEVCLNICVLKYLTVGTEISSFLTSM